MRRVVDFEIADDVDQHFQFARSLDQFFFQFFGFSDGCQRFDRTLLLDDAIFVRFERIFFQQELNALTREVFGLLDDLGLKRVNCVGLDVFQLFQ